MITVHSWYWGSLTQTEAPTHCVVSLNTIMKAACESTMFPRLNIMIYIWPFLKIALSWPQELCTFSFYSSFTCNFCHRLHPASYFWKHWFTGTYGAVLQREVWGAPSQPTTFQFQSFLSCTLVSLPSKPGYAFFLHMAQKGSPVCCLARHAGRKHFSPQE